MENNQTSPNILVVEDQTIVALDIKKTLESLNFKVTAIASDYNTALNSVRINKPDLILMDINLGSGKDGIETIEKIHTIEKIPVIYITAFSDEITIERAIKTEPICYIIKPFKREELKSNIQLGLYKIKKETKENVSPKEIHIGLDYYYNFQENNLYFKNFPISLSKKENLLLRILIEAENKIVPFKEIEERIWPNTEVSTSTLRTLIYRLRSKLEHKIIETIQKVGCRLSKEF
ncbi:response regulator [Halarcobacter sp.]|uniref:response regulator n=1 Tax=Halarcobacter sp. TaxID=2321133 RepID=UPI002AA8AD8C|nr:response regulator [Halarcobacter sp.]